MYCSHRNETFDKNDKCFRPHGHHYKIRMIFNYPLRFDFLSLTKPFSEFEKIEKLIKDQFDHRMFVHSKDPLLLFLQDFERTQETPLGLVVLPFPSSVENVCFLLFNKVREQLGFKELFTLEIKETETSTIVYNSADYINDCKLFESLESNTKS